MPSSIILSENNAKLYFDKIFELENLGEDFPVDFDDVWPLMYSRKGNAKRDLISGFIEGEDFNLIQFEKVVSINELVSGTPYKCKISVSCMEYFVVRKKREVFDVYRECRKKIQKEEKSTSLLPDDPDVVLELVQKWRKDKIKLEEANNIIEDQKPKVLFTEAVQGSKSSCLVAELAELIAQNGYSIGQNRLYTWLRENNYLVSRGERRNLPVQRYVEQGLFEIKRGVRSGNDGEMKTTSTTKVTGKGQVYFINKFVNVKEVSNG